ncbi:MAG: inositol-3-phosphate synthase, partial [Planctomycetota bacterium]
MINNKCGVWFIGARGAVATTGIIGAKALAKGLIAPNGLVTELPDIKETGFVPFRSIVFGGHEIRRSSFKQAISQLGDTGINIDHKLLNKLEKEIREVDREIKTGLTSGSGSLQETVRRLIKDIASFRKRHVLDNVIVVNLASTEPPVKQGPHTRTLTGFEAAIGRNRKDLLPASCLYAYAAFKTGCPYINFTPSAGSSIPALRELARQLHLPHTGNDGKTGETLVKSALAPLFNYRALKVLSWQGYNILGNQDGKVLSNPKARASKVQSKNTALANILGYQPHSYVGINYVPSLGDWKTAWDFIHFEGFMGTKMSLQFTWQGCDSILAAPLVLDLIRLVDL